MTDPDRLGRFLRTKLQGAGRQYEEARRAFRDAHENAVNDVATDEELRLVCRRHAEKRKAGLDSDGRPTCFEAGHPDCEGCVEDIRAGCIETW